MHIHERTSVRVHGSTPVHIHLHMYKGVHVYTYMTVNLCIYLRVHLCIYMGVHTCIYMRTHVYIYESIHVHTHGSTHVLRSPRSTSSTFNPLLYPVFLVSLTEPEARWFSYSGWPLCFGVLLSPSALGYSCVTSCPAFSMGSGDLSSGPHSCGYQPTG